MATDTASAIEFRCKTCWQSVLAPIESENTSIACPHCSSDTMVPEATESNIRDAEAVAEEPRAPVQEPEMPSDAEMYRMVREESSLPVHEMDFRGHPDASVLRRFLAYCLDTLLGFSARVVGFIAPAILIALGAFDAQTIKEIPFWASTLIFFTPLAAVYLVQWNLIITRGQTIGKFVCLTRIVTTGGKTPGLLHGVILRDWPRMAIWLSAPFIGGTYAFLLLVVDAGLGLCQPYRCGHDYIAGTRVIEA